SLCEKRDQRRSRRNTSNIHTGGLAGGGGSEPGRVGPRSRGGPPPFSPIPAIKRQGSDRLPDCRLCGARAKLLHHANYRISWSKRWSWGAGILPAAQQDI